MDKFGMTELQQLIDSREGPCLTICMPTHVAGIDGQQDVVRLKNLTQKAEEELSDGWMRPAAARTFVAAVRELWTDPVFWEHRSHGLALFRDETGLSSFRVPLPLEELALVNRRFHIKPLLPLVSSGDRFLILALSQNKTRLLQATRFEIAEVKVGGLPTRMEEALNFDTADRGAQVHSGGKQGTGKQAGVFHGQGGERETHKDNLALFFRMVDKALTPVLRSEQAPLLLAGVDYLLPIFRQVSHYPRLAGQELVGNFDKISLGEIHEKAWQVMQPVFDDVRTLAVANYRRLAGTGKVSDDVHDIVPAAAAGRVETLFVELRKHRWGTFDPRDNVVEIHDRYERGDDDLLDLASARTLINRGNVHTVESSQMPIGGPIAAVYRY